VFFINIPIGIVSLLTSRLLSDPPTAFRRRRVRGDRSAVGVFDTPISQNIAGRESLSFGDGRKEKITPRGRALRANSSETGLVLLINEQ
jgi:hypothetical protein